MRTLLALVGVLALALLTPTLTRAQTSELLTESDPKDGFVAASGGQAYYKIALPSTIPAESTGVTINVTPLGDGNPDLYADWTEFPSTTRYTYRSRNWGEDTIFVPTADVGAHTDLFLAVIGSYRASNFTVVYTVDAAITLSDGQGQYSFVHKAGLAKFVFTPAARVGVAIAVTGRTRVYIGTQDLVPPIGPNPNWLWSSNYLSGSVNIAATDPNWPAPGAPFYLTVYGVVDTYFMLSASLNGTATELPNGLAVSGTLDQNDNAYYSYTIQTAGCQLQFSLSVLYGDPDLYVSSSVEKPNPGSCPMGADPQVCTISTSYGGDTVTLDPASVATYHVGVNAYTPSSYTILAQTVCPDDSFQSAATQLLDGVSQHGGLPARSYRFYSFIGPATAADITFSVSARQGDPDIYIRADGVQPSRSNYQWSSTHVGSDTIVVRANDARACAPNPPEVDQPCRYYIYVWAYSDCDFYISASTPNEQVILFEGQPLTNTLQTGQAQYYSISAYVRSYRQAPLVISVTDMSGGDPDLFVSRTQQQPSSADNQWAAQRNHDDAVNIFPSDPNYCVGDCIYYVGVYASQTTTYSIMFHLDQPSSLASGVTQQGNVPASGYNFYAFRVNSGYGQVQITLTSRVGYANLLVTNREDVYPILTNSSTYQEYVPWYRGTQALVTINEGDAGACIPSTGLGVRYCTFVIGVQGYSNCSYTIAAAVNSGTDQSASLLLSGRAQSGQVAHSVWQYFKVIVSSPNMNLAVVLTATSGDPDLYISDSVLPTLTQGTYNWSSLHSGGDSITLTSVTPGTFFIGVYGWSQYNSTFSITATIVDPSQPPTNNIIQLNDGEQQSGSGAGGAYVYYQISIPSFPVVSNLLITVTKISGDPDLYLRYDAGFPTIMPVRTDPSTYTQKATAYGDDTIQVNLPILPGTYTIGVQAFATQASWIIAASTGLSIQRLSDGVPRRGAVTQGKYSYFRIFMDSVSDLQITVTPFTGDPDLYVSSIYEFPNNTVPFYEYSSTAFRSDSVTIPHGSACSGCNFYIAVYGFFTSTFLITAQFNNEQAVLESVPVDGSAVANGMNYYSFDMAAISSGSIDISIVNTNGLGAIYVSMSTEPTAPSGGTPGVYDYVATGSYSGALLHIDDAAAACQLHPLAPGEACTMHIGISAIANLGYTMLVTWVHSERNINLINGRSVPGTLALHAYEYYTITVPDNGMDLVVTVQSFSGDADLYMSDKLDTGVHPNQTNYVWRSMSGSTDTITVHAAQSHPGPYFIGIYGYSACRYTITAYAFYENSTMVPVVLTDGVPASSVIGARDIRYYSFYLTGRHDDLTISLTSSLGDPDLFVTTDGTLPSRTHYNYSSTRFGSDQLTIQAPVTAMYTIGVFADTTTVYSIVAVTHEASLELIAGTSFAEDLFTGQTEYFFTDVMDTVNDLTITVTSLNGDPDLYVSDINPTPSVRNYTYAATSFRNDSITIPSALLHTGRYYIAVYSFLNCSFTILATYQNQTLLQDGRPQSDSVLKEQSKYYEYRSQYTTNDIVFSVTPLTGFARLYVQLGSEPIWNDPTTYTWSSLNAFTSQLVVIQSGDPNACQPNPSDPNAYCSYYILVRGGSNCDYSITVSAGLNAIDLQEGHPLQATAPSLGYRHFRFWVSNPQNDVAITVTPLSGDPDIFVVTSVYDTQHIGASQSFYQWKSVYYGGDTLQVLYDDTNFALGEWEISIYGASSITSAFVIVATTSPRSGNISTIQLVDGLPLGGRVRVSGGYNYYTYQPSDPHTGIAFNVAKRYGDPDVFIKMFPSVPSYTDYIWQGSHSGSDYVVVNGADPRACGVAPTLDPCVFLIAVRGYTATSYTITVTSQMVTGQLQSGIPVFGFVEQYKYIYYFIDVSEDQPTLQISVTSISTGGDPDLYVSTRYLQPNRTANEWRASSWGSEEITIVPAPRNKYYIGVYGWSNDSFSITATYNSSVTLAPGQPYSDSVATYGAIRFYNFHVDVGSTTPPAGGLTVSLNAAVNGYVDLYINLGATAGPGQANGWTSLATSVSGGRYIYIPPTDTQACWTGDSCTYSLAVQARSYGTFSYSLTYFYGDDVITLEPAVPFSAQVVQGSYVLFRAMVALSTQDISISSTGLIGDVALYVAQNTSEPNSSNYTWSATVNSQIGLHVAISATDPAIATGWLYIAVYGVTNAQFSLLLTTDNVMLISGSPQDAVCGYGGASKYFFMNFQNNADGSTQQADIIFDIVGRTPTDTFALYIVTDSSAPGITKPNMTTATWHPELVSGAPFRIPPTDPFYCTQNCTFYVAVACTSSSPWWKGYTITASTADVLEVVEVGSAPTTGGVLPLSAKFYEVYLQTATNFSFILEPCVGEVDLYTSTTYRRPDKLNHDQLIASHDAPDVFYYAAPAGQSIVNSIFFGVQETKGIAANFLVKTLYVDQFHSDSPIVPSSTLPPVALGEGSISFLVTPAQSALNTDPSKLVYTVYYSPDTTGSVILYTECGVTQPTVQSLPPFTINSTAAYKVTLTGLDDTLYKFNVFVSDPAATTGPTAYSVQTAQPSSGPTPGPGGDGGGGGSGVSKVLLGVLIPVGVIVLALLAYLFIKNRRLSQELEVEMGDVPSAALRKAARGAPDVSKVERAQRHHKLLGEEEDDSSSDTYVAPSSMAGRRLQDL